MAEATLLVSGARSAGDSPTARGVRMSDTYEVVSCGRSSLCDIRIVSSEGGAELRDGVEGEIWVHGPSVAAGYLNRPEETRATFANYLPNDSMRTYLRTGDLGMMIDGALFVTGRLKNMVIVRGENYYPHDIEASCEQAHDRLRNCQGAAFTVPGEEQDLLVIVHEAVIKSRAELAEVERAIRTQVFERHDLRVCNVVLIPKGTLPRTTSGKIQRALCKKMFLSNELFSPNEQAGLRPRNFYGYLTVAVESAAFAAGVYGLHEVPPFGLWYGLPFVRTIRAVVHLHDPFCTGIGLVFLGQCLFGPQLVPTSTSRGVGG